GRRQQRRAVAPALGERQLVERPGVVVDVDRRGGERDAHLDASTSARKYRQGGTSSSAPASVVKSAAERGTRLRAGGAVGTFIETLRDTMLREPGSTASA